MEPRLKARIDNRKKNLVKQQYLLRMSSKIANIGPLASEICWRVWGIPANFSGFRVLPALLHGTLVVGVSQTAALNRGRHLHSAGRPSRWALAHILVVSVFIGLKCGGDVRTVYCSSHCHRPRELLVPRRHTVLGRRGTQP